MASKFWLWYGHTFFALEERIDFFDRLADLLDANFAILQALRVYLDGYAKKMDSTDTRLIFIRDVVSSMESGKGFASAVSSWVSPTERVLLDAGEKSGHLPEALRSCGQVARNSQEIRSSIKTQLIEPAINATIFLGTAIYTARDIFPIFLRMSNPKTWGGFLYWWYAISEFISHDILYIVVGFLAYAAFAWWSLPRLRDGPFRRALEKLPPWNVYKRLQGAVFVDAMAAMLRGGTNFRRAIDKIQSQSSPYLASKLDQALDKLVGNDASGKNAAEVFDIGLLPPDSVVQIGIYAQGKELEKNLGRLALFNTKATLQWIGSRIGTVALLIDTASVGYTMLSLLAMMDLSRALSGGA
jgi:type II secretory pathway component PulF